MFVTFDVSHEFKSWLNDEAPLNKYEIYVTFDVSHEPIG